jgi:hypothetical protein
MTKHTPGPIEMKARWVYKGCGCKSQPYPEIDETLCPLHAAAPDLLEAAKEVWEQMKTEMPDKKESLKYAPNCWHRLKEAIAKAEGREV